MSQAMRPGIIIPEADQRIADAVVRRMVPPGMRQCARTHRTARGSGFPGDTTLIVRAGDEEHLRVILRAAAIEALHLRDMGTP